MRTRYRRIVVLIHVWVGLLIGAFVSVLGISGSLLVFRHELDRALNPGFFSIEPRGERITLNRVLELVGDAYPESRPARIGFPRLASDPFEVWLDGRGERRAYIDPYRAEVLGDRYMARSAAGYLRRLHVDLLAGTTGETVAGAFGLLLVVLIITGLIIWWPGIRKIGHGLRIRWRGSMRVFFYEGHRTLGAAIAIFLLISSLTGVCLVFDGTFHAALGWLSPAAELGVPTTPVPPTDQPKPSLDVLLAIADREIPGAKTTWIVLPANPNTAVTIRMRLPGEAQYNGKNYVYIDPHRGEVLRTVHAFRCSAGTRIANLRYPLHTGELGGVALRMVALLVGLAPLLLFLTGGLSWWLRRRRQRIVSSL